MKSAESRMTEFVKYHIEGDGECNNVVLKAYADKHGLDTQQRFDLAYFFAVTYCVCSAILLFNDRDEIKRNPREYARTMKSDIIFQSDRKYVRMLDNFENMLVFWAENLQDSDKQTKQFFEGNRLILKRAIPIVSKWYYFGRFGAFLYLETLAWLIEAKVENYTIEWKSGSTATSGLMNVFCLDDYANYFDKNKKLKVNPAELDLMLKRVAEKIENAGGNSDTTQVETSLCAYRKFYKGTRYNGYYLDRMLEEIVWYEKHFPCYKNLTEELKKIRSEKFKKRYLGERMGWNKIRIQMKKSYLMTNQIL